MFSVHAVLSGDRQDIEDNDVVRDVIMSRDWFCTSVAHRQYVRAVSSSSSSSIVVIVIVALAMAAANHVNDTTRIEGEILW